MRIPFRIVDVFADYPLSGNQLCVVPEPIDADADMMKAIAKEIGFSETTFVTRIDDDRYSMRIFTPGGELPFAGHPTLGTAFVLVDEGRITTPAVQEVAAGEFQVAVDLWGSFVWMRQHGPVFGEPLPSSAHPKVAKAMGLKPRDLHPDLPPQPVSTGLNHLIVPATTVEAVRRASPNPALIGEVTEDAGTDAVYLFALSGEGRVKARLFAPGVGVPEDPATGSAAGSLGAYLASRRARATAGRITISQGEEIGRPSTLHVEVRPDGDSWNVLVGGGVWVVGSGAFEI